MANNIMQVIVSKVSSSVRDTLIAVACTLLVGFVLYKAITYKTPAFKAVEIVYNNTVSNLTNKNYLDTIVHVGLNNLGVKGSVMTLRPLDPNTKSILGESGELKAHIKYRNGMYDIFISDNISKYEAVQIISHELVHLQQYEKGSLVIGKNNTPIWKGEVFDMSKAEYERLPWEAEAFLEQGRVQRGIEAVLY